MRKIISSISIIIAIQISIISLGIPQTIAQSTGEYDITFEELRYQNETLHAPRSSTRYAVSLPASWNAVSGSYLTLDLEYLVETFEDEDYIPISLVEVWFNSEIVGTQKFSIPDNQQLHIELPPDLFRNPLGDDQPNIIEVLFISNVDCDRNVDSSVIILNSSAIHLAYEEGSLPIDLALLPLPLYQRWAVETEHVHFAIPDEPDEATIQAATTVAARLGQLTSNRLPISVTLTSEQLNSPTPEGHFIIVGKPEENQLIEQLDLPIPLVERRLDLRSQMPAEVSPGSVFSYTVFVENTSEDEQLLVVEDRFSPLSTFVDCEGDCEQITPDKYRWDIGTLAAGELVSTTVILQVAQTISPNTVIRHTATLFDAQEDILNVDTLSAKINWMPEGQQVVVSSPFKSKTFFVEKDTNTAVPEDAGVLQEIISPWNPQRVVIVITGASDDAVLKAAQGLNPQNQFPGIWGASAVIEDVHPVSRTVTIPSPDQTLDSLGYRNEELQVIDGEASEYLFDFPLGTTLNEDSYLMLHLAHSPQVSAVGGNFRISLNGISIGSVLLDDSNLNDTWLQIPLSETAIQPGLNRLRIASMVDIVDKCVVKDNYWAMIYNDSFLHLNYKPARTKFDLNNFPYPFNSPGDMGNVIFSLPEVPGVVEIEGLLRIASLLGSGSESQELNPFVLLGQTADLTSLNNSHIIAIGLPTMNPLIQIANDSLPQPFLPDSNDIYQRIDNPIYMITPGTDLGYVQQLNSPWGKGRNLGFIAATGTTQAGVDWAVSALSESPQQLSGNLALIRDGDIYTTDTLADLAVQGVITKTMPITPTVAVEETAEVSSEIIATPQLTTSQESLVTPTFTLQEQAVANDKPVYGQTTIEQSRPRWLLPLLILSALSTVVLAVMWYLKKD